MDLSIRRITPHDGPLLRGIRLRALQTDPDAFGSNYELEVGRSDAEWALRAERGAEGDTQFIALGLSREEGVGMVGGYQPEQATHTRWLYGMWVAPEARSSGVGFDLAKETVDWARTAGAESIHLWVVTSNQPALRLYRSVGFRETGKTQPLPSNRSLAEIEMSLTLT